MVDHKLPHKGDYELFWESTNWVALCKQCHDRKTARERKAMAKWVVCGPPGCGKTTWVKARARPGDLIFDADYLLMQMFSTRLHEPVEFAATLVERLRASVVDWLQHYPDRHAYVIQADQMKATETARWLSAELVVLTPRPTPHQGSTTQ